MVTLLFHHCQHSRAAFVIGFVCPFLLEEILGKPGGTFLGCEESVLLKAPQSCLGGFYGGYQHWSPAHKVHWRLWQGDLDCCDPALLAFRAVASWHLSGWKTAAWSLFWCLAGWLQPVLCTLGMVVVEGESHAWLAELLLMSYLGWGRAAITS